MLIYHFALSVHEICCHIEIIVSVAMTTAIAINHNMVTGNLIPRAMCTFHGASRL